MKTPLDDQIVFLKPSDLADFLELSAMTDQPVFTWGLPGVGKTSIIEQVVTQRLKWRFLATRLLGKQDVDLVGLPSITDGKTVWNRPEDIPFGEEPIVWFLDEVNRKDQQMMNMMLQPVLEKKLSVHRLPQKMVVFCAGNFEDDPGVVKQSSAFSLRFRHVGAMCDVNDWAKWAKAAGVDPVVIAYNLWRPEFHHTFDPKQKASPNPRTWVQVSKSLRVFEDKAPRLLQAAVIGDVGKAAGTDFMGFHRLKTSLPSFDSIIMNPKGTPVPPADKPDQSYAIAAGLARKASPKNIDRIMIYLDRMQPEFAQLCVSMAERRLGPAISSTPEYTAWYIDHPEATA